MLLHVGGTSTAGVIVAVIVIFFLIFAMSFAFGAIPEGKRRYTSDWAAAWFRVSWPRLLVAGVFSGALLAGALLWGNGNNTAAVSCDSPLAPFTGQTVTDIRIATAIDGMQRLAQAARDGDANEVRAIFYTEDAHNLTHDIDRTLRQHDAEIGKKLCQQVVALEGQMAGAFETGRIAIQADSIGVLLGDARIALRNATATSQPSAAGPCQSPIGAVTSNPLTADRINAAAADLRQTAEVAATGDRDAATLVFFGDAHNISHDIDGPLRQVDNALVVNLCLSILALEEQFAAGQMDADVVSREAQNSAGLLEDAGRALGILK